TELWKSDGTDAGTVLIPNTANIQFNTLTPVGATLFFTAYNPASFSYVLYRLDGTTLRSIFTGYPQQLTAVGGNLFLTSPSSFSASPVSVEGSPPSANPSMIHSFAGPANLTNVGGELYFTDSNAFGWLLWKSDGTIGGTVEVAAVLNAQVPPPRPTAFTDV